MPLPNPWWWLSNSGNSWWKFTVIPLISARPGTCWKSFYFLCGLHTLFYFARKTGQGKGRRLWLLCSVIGHSKSSSRHRSSMSCITKYFGLYNQFFRSSSEKDVTLPQVMYSSASPCLPSKKYFLISIPKSWLLKVKAMTSDFLPAASRWSRSAFHFDDLLGLLRASFQLNKFP